MSRLMTAAVTAAIAAAAVQTPAAQATPATGGTADEAVCKYVVSDERGSKPFRMCLTQSQWAAKEAKDAENANRIVCRYEDVPGSKFKSRKICQPASEWAEQRRLHREQVEDIQMRVCVGGAGC